MPVLRHALARLRGFYGRRYPTGVPYAQFDEDQPADAPIPFPDGAGPFIDPAGLDRLRAAIRNEDPK